MTHPNLNDLSQADLDYEIGQSKQCLENHGFNPTIFAYPNGKGGDNPKVVNTVAINQSIISFFKAIKLHAKPEGIEYVVIACRLFI